MGDHWERMVSEIGWLPGDGARSKEQQQALVHERIEQARVAGYEVPMWRYEEQRPTGDPEAWVVEVEAAVDLLKSHGFTVTGPDGERL